MTRDEVFKNPYYRVFVGDIDGNWKVVIGHFGVNYRTDTFWEKSTDYGTNRSAALESAAQLSVQKQIDIHIVPAKFTDHCWHLSGLVGSSKSTPHRRDICCHCGSERETSVYFNPDVKHGPFLDRD